MATVQTRAPRAKLTLPPTARNIRAAVKAGTRPPKAIVAKASKPAKEAKTHTLPKVGKAVMSALTNELGKAHRGHTDALNIEVCVGLTLYSTKVGDEDKRVSLDAKRALMAVYADAGYACKLHTDEDYKTVNRRINAVADLFMKLGGRQTVVDWIDGAAPTAQVSMILPHIEKLRFEGVNSILHYVGKVGTRKRPRNGTIAGSTSNQGAAPSEADNDMAQMTGAAVDQRRQDEQAGNRRSIDKLPLGRQFKAGAMFVAVPLEATYRDVMTVIQQLTDFANNILRVDQEQPTADVSTKAPATA